MFSPYTHHGIGTPDYMCPYCVTPWKCNGPHIYEDDLPQYNADMRVAYEQGLEDARDAVDVALLGTLQTTRDRAIAAIDALRSHHDT